MVVGGGYSENSSGTFTYAKVGAAAGKNIDYSPNTISNGLAILMWSVETPTYFTPRRAILQVPAYKP